MALTPGPAVGYGLVCPDGATSRVTAERPLADGRTGVKAVAKVKSAGSVVCASCNWAIPVAGNAVRVGNQIFIYCPECGAETLLEERRGR